MEHPILPIDRMESALRSQIKRLYPSRGIEPTATHFGCKYLSDCRTAADSRNKTFATGSWPYVGSEYGRAIIAGRAARVLFVAMDRGGWDSAMNESFPETQRNFREATVNRHNPHMGGVSIIMEHLVDGSTREQYANQFALTNALKCVEVTENARTNPTVLMRRNCAAHLEAEIAVLKPDIVITQGQHPHDTILKVFRPARIESYGDADRFRAHVSLYRADHILVLTTPHPARLKGLAWKRGVLPSWFGEGVSALRKSYAGLNA